MRKKITKKMKKRKSRRAVNRINYCVVVDFTR